MRNVGNTRLIAVCIISKNYNNNKNVKGHEYMKRKSKCSTAKAILSNLHALRERRYVGDLDASDTLLDFERACEMVQLTKRQLEAIRLVYDGDLTQRKAAEIMRVSFPAISRLLTRAIGEIDEVYLYWELRGNEYKEAN